MRTLLCTTIIHVLIYKTLDTPITILYYTNKSYINSIHTVVTYNHTIIYISYTNTTSLIDTYTVCGIYTDINKFVFSY